MKNWIKNENCLNHDFNKIKKIDRIKVLSTETQRTQSYTEVFQKGSGLKAQNILAWGNALRYEIAGQARNDGNKKLRIFWVVLFVLFLSCNTSSVEKQPIQEEDSLTIEMENQIIQNEDSLFFMKMISVLPDIKLPYSMWCGIESYQYPNAEDLGSDIVKLVPEPSSVIVGKLPINNDKVYVLYGLVGDIIYPVLSIYDKNGNRIDSSYLHISYCYGDCEVIMSTATTISKDFSIYMTDTAQYFNCIENDEGYEQIKDSVIVKTRKMNLTKDGYYKITKETKQ